MVVLLNGSIGARSTEALRDYVATTLTHLRIEVERHGDEVRDQRSFQRIERSLRPSELRRTWPHADVERVLREVDELPRVSTT
jgi:hypothetical protein